MAWFKRNQQELFAILVPAMLLAVLGYYISVHVERDQLKQNEQNIQHSLDTKARQLADAIVEKMTIYQYGLRGMRGAVLSAGPQNFGYKNMLAYSQSRDLNTEFPGARGFGVIRKVTQDQLTEFLLEATKDRGQLFKLNQYSPHQHDLFVIQYIEPVVDNSSAVGLDISSETMRYQAALAAAHQNKAVLTEPLTLVQAQNKKSQGFLLLMPIYLQQAIPEQAEQRYQQLFGFAYTPLLIDEILFSINAANKGIQLEVVDLEHSPEQPFFVRAVEGSALAELHSEAELTIFSRNWQVKLVASQSFINQLELQNPQSAFYSALSITALVILIVAFFQLALIRRLQLSRHRAVLAAIVENANEAVIGTDKEGRISSWNPAAEQMFGYGEDEAIGKSISTLIVPEELKAEQLQLELEVSKGHKVRYKQSMRLHQSGKLYPVSLNLAPILDEKGQFIGAALTVNDISHIKQAEQKLQQANEELEHQVALRTAEIERVSTLQRSILRNANYAIITTDLDGVITSFNPAAETMLQYQEVELAGLYSPALFHDPAEVLEYAEQLTTELGYLVEPGFAVFVEKAKHGKTDNREWNYIRKDGSRCPVQLAVTSLLDQQKQVVGYLGIARDLTLQKDLEFELALAKVSTEQSPDLVFWLNDAADVIKANPAALACSAGKLSLADLALQLVGDRLQQLILSTERKRSVQFETQFEDSHGVLIPLSATLSWIRFEQQDYFYLVARDRSEQHKREQELAYARRLADAANDAKSSFLANMSHEIRTPMNAILGMLQLVQQTSLTRRQEDYIRQTEMAAESLLAILNDILDFSKVEAGKLEMDSHSFELASLMEDLGTILSANLGSKDVEVLYQFAEDLPQLVVGDSLRLKQVLLNLTGNAIKFTEKGEIVVSLQVTERTAEATKIKFKVTDTGIGMTEQQLAVIFQSFSQAESSISRRYGGTGLGLAISKGLVELMGGQLSVDSQWGSGSCFEFELWFNCLSLNAAQADLSLLQGLKVLVVDDNQQSRQILSEVMRHYGCQVDLASSGEQALQLLQQQNGYKLVLLDWLMPGMDGWQTAEKIRQLVQGPEMPLVIMVTAHGRECLAQKQQEEQSQHLLNGFIVKPVTPSRLLDAVLDALAGKQMFSNAQQDAAPRQSRLNGLQLLLVEDNPTNQIVASELLGNEGALVEIAPGGTFALAMLEQQPDKYDLVLMDIQMPDMDGYETTRRIRSKAAMLALPIVAMTANAMQSDKQACLDAGMNDHVAKPFAIDNLVQTILKWSKTPVDPSLPVAAIQQPLLNPALVDAALQQGVQLNSALNRLGNSVSVYHKTLKSFVTELDAALIKLKAGPAALTEKELYLLAHSLKGSASSLGIVRLSEPAAAIEQSIKQKTALDLPKALLTFVADAEAFARFAPVLMAETAPAEEEPIVLMPSDTEMSELLGQLQSSLQSFNMNALAQFSELKGALQSLNPEWVSKLETALEQLNFIQALQYTEQYQTLLKR
ncbi:CHASE domain-containing hybrid sensor histidine kinase/response regulator [Rheinheimera mangrovi]|uniref:CHASE domain-containing hybrid sensor histidine kinase/response regulator n=1 Tax=Rheinheimera mangrovi TaxID=2498451 RepID=UPI000F8E28DB|nr:response regulator [Rheinheimera mangrovi]